MQSVSKQYKRSMKSPLRNQSHMKVTIGVINQVAQRTAYVSNQEACVYFSDFTKPFNNFEIEPLYATCEQNYSSVDGSMAFLPRNSENVLLNNGIVSEELLGVIEIQFSTPFLDIKGLTIDFGKAYPVDFIIESDNNTVTIEGNTRQMFITSEVFLSATFIRITPSRMMNGQSRLRINSITMGIGIYFDNKKIISASKKDYVSPTSDSMPAVDFTLTIDNQSMEYDIEDTESTVNFFETGQELLVEYGYDVDEDTTEWISGGKLFLKDWTADDTQAKFTAVDLFANMQDTYYKGKYYLDGISLYDLAVDVITDAEVEDYWLDPYLKNIIVHNPMPVVKHKEALQIIANAGRCVLSQDRNARIFLKASFVPDITVTSDNGANHSKVENILNRDIKQQYADATNNFTLASGTQFFLPRSSEYLNTGYVSEAVAGVDGLFINNPSITLELEASFKTFGFTLGFGGNLPTEVVIKTYLQGELLEELFINEIEQITLIEHEFPEFDQMIIEFIKATPNNRVLVDWLEFGNVTDYVLEHSSDLLKMPKGNQLEKVKELQVTRTLYSQSIELKELISEEIIINDTEFRFDFSNPVYGLTCSSDDTLPGQTVEITESGAYYVIISFTGFSEGSIANVVISGYEYTLVTAKVTQALNSTGSVKTWTNPLISSSKHAKDLAEWVGNHLQSDKEYELSYRGDPRIDANDVLFLENKNLGNLQIRAYEHTVNFNGALSGSMKARRVM